jgi:hypothetical protein
MSIPMPIGLLNLLKQGQMRIKSVEKPMTGVRF